MVPHEMSHSDVVRNNNTITGSTHITLAYVHKLAPVCSLHGHAPHTELAMWFVWICVIMRMCMHVCGHVCIVCVPAHTYT